MLQVFDISGNPEHFLRFVDFNTGSNMIKLKENAREPEK